MKNKFSIIIFNEQTEYNKTFNLSKIQLIFCLIFLVTCISAASILIYSFLTINSDNILNANLATQTINNTEFIKTSKLIAPLKDGIITQGIDKNHQGIDIACEFAALVRSIADGTIIFANELIDYGYTVIIEHDDGYYSKYSHMNKLAVTSHSMVSAGTLIGYAGQSGELADGPHLHFEIWKKNVIIDPRTIIKEYYNDVSEKK